MTLEIKTNCSQCLKDKHDLCLNENCLCRQNKHGSQVLTLKDGVSVDHKKIIDPGCCDDVKADNRVYSKESNDKWDLVAEEIQSNNYFLTLRENRHIWYYNKQEGIYKPYGHTIIEEQCQIMINKCQNKTVKEITETIRRNKTMIDMKELFESNHINVQNGILDPKAFQLYHHSPEYHTTSKLPFSVNSEARNLKLWNHILGIIDVKDINLLMELVWICISWNNPFKKMFVFKGATNTQKSTLADILVWIIGSENVSRERPTKFLNSNDRFSTSKFIGKRINIASEIGNLTLDMIENQKSLIGAELQNTERKADNTERYFDPTKFVFLYTTNTLNKIYSSIDDNSLITRYQFLIFRNQLDESKTNGQWYDQFFDDVKDRQSAIDTIINIIINYKKAQSLKKIPKTKWSDIADTKRILKEEMPKEDQYFEQQRIISKEGSRISLEDIKKDFENFVGYKIDNQRMGYILKKNGMKSHKSNNQRYYNGYTFKTNQDLTKF
jgi:phage/plasmid-associated DNA primase